MYLDAKRVEPFHQLCLGLERVEQSEDVVNVEIRLQPVDKESRLAGTQAIALLPDLGWREQETCNRPTKEEKNMRTWNSFP